MADGVVVEFPLRGEWRALNTPAHRVPSHGTDYFGQRYAYDFVRSDSDAVRFQPGSMARHLSIGVPASSFYCWDAPVYSAFAGEVILAADGWPDRTPVRALLELVRATVVPISPRGDDYRPLTGNCVLMRGEPGVALYAHLRRGSVAVRSGQRVAAGEPLGTVGNSGNSTMPHLHFHVMDGVEALAAAGVACAFRRYERFVDGGWQAVAGGMPGRLERIRST